MGFGVRGGEPRSATIGGGNEPRSSGIAPLSGLDLSRSRNAVTITARASEVVLSPFFLGWCVYGYK